MSEAKVICPACGDTHDAPGGDRDFMVKSISRCDVCDARIVYGALAPRVVIEPGTFDNGAPAFVLLAQDPKTRAVVHEMKLDPQHAFLLAQAIISMVRP